MLKGKKYLKLLFMIVDEYLATQDFETTYVNTESIREQLNNYICRDYFPLNTDAYDPSLLNEAMCIMFADGFNNKPSMAARLLGQDKYNIRLVGVFDRIIYNQICGLISHNSSNNKQKAMNNYQPMVFDQLEEHIGYCELTYDDVEDKIMLEEFAKYLKNVTHKRIVEKLIYYKYDRVANTPHVVKQSDIASELGISQASLSVLCKNIHVHYVKFQNGVPFKKRLTDKMKKQYGVATK